MITLIMVIHVVVSVLLILTVMVQGSKSEGLSGLLGGGGSGTLFGTETPSFLVKVTTVLGIVFMLSSISLTVILSRRPPSVMEKSVIQQEESVPEDVENPLR